MSSRGQLIHEVLRIIDGKKPQVVFIENVRGMATIHKGRDLRAVLNEFKKRGYHVYWTILKSSDFGVPQNRERLTKSWKVEDGHGVFVNPPYCKIQGADLLAWVNKISDEYKSNGQPIFALVPARATETRWFQRLFESATHIVFLRQRLVHNDTVKAKKANFPSALVVFGGNQLEQKKLEYLSQLGPCLETPSFRKAKSQNDAGLAA